jgi:hypothetical protein
MVESGPVRYQSTSLLDSSPQKTGITPGRSPSQGFFIVDQLSLWIRRSLVILVREIARMNKIRY